VKLPWPIERTGSPRHMPCRRSRPWSGVLRQTPNGATSLRRLHIWGVSRIRAV
jgi:hypothetical protein